MPPIFGVADIFTEIPISTDSSSPENPHPRHEDSRANVAVHQVNGGTPASFIIPLPGPPGYHRA
jgi:hypothetical protein